MCDALDGGAAPNRSIRLSVRHRRPTKRLKPRREKLIFVLRLFAIIMIASIWTPTASCAAVRKSAIACYQTAEDLYNVATTNIRSNPIRASRSAENSANMVLACPPPTSLQLRFSVNPPRLVAGSRLILAAEIAHEAGERSRPRQLLKRALNLLQNVRPQDLQSGMKGAPAEEIAIARNALAGRWTNYY